MAIHSKKDAFSSLAFSSHSPPTPPGTSRQMAKDAGGICAQKVEVFLRLSFLPFPAMASAVIRIPFQWPSAKSNRARERIGRCRGWSESKVFNLVEKWKRRKLDDASRLSIENFYLPRSLARWLPPNWTIRTNEKDARDSLKHEMKKLVFGWKLFYVELTQKLLKRKKLRARVVREWCHVEIQVSDELLKWW